MHSERQVVGYYSAHVRTQAVTDARQLVHVETGRPQVGQHGGHALGHGLHVVHGGRVTRQRWQLAPVHHEHVVFTTVQIRCEWKLDNNRLNYYWTICSI